jgi:hypothetical protein
VHSPSIVKASLIALLGLFIMAPGLKAEIRGKLLVDGSETGTVRPGQPSELVFGFADATGQQIKDFDLEHEKYMHLIVVSKDLEHFAHVHPDLGAATGLFKAKVNQTTSDPDNQDLARAIAKAGDFFLFAEVKPHEQRHVELTRFTVKAEGQAQAVPLTLDTVGANGIRKYFNADSTPGQNGAPYQATLTVEKMDHDGMHMVHLSLNVSAWHAAMHHYMGVNNLENWLGMPAHGILVGAKGDAVADRVFRHLHSGHHDHGMMAHDSAGDHDHDHGGGSAGPDLMFMLHDDDIPPAGVYKFWAQVKHKGHILTFPFVIQL